MKSLRLSGRMLAERNRLIDYREMQACARCGVEIWNYGSRHHRKLRSRGGGDEVSNGVLLCGSGTTGCHGWAHANPEAATLLGFIVPSTADPACVPILHALYGWVLINDEGTAESCAPPD